MSAEDLGPRRGQLSRGLQAPPLCVRRIRKEKLSWLMKGRLELRSAGVPESGCLLSGSRGYWWQQGRQPRCGADLRGRGQAP